MTGPVLILTDQLSEDDKGIPGDGRPAFNEMQAGYRDRRPLAALSRDPDTGTTLGGTVGPKSYGLLFVDPVCLPHGQRGQDTGSRPLAITEKATRCRGREAGFVLTASFQAPGFDQRPDRAEPGWLACDPPGTARIFMTKGL